MTIDELSEDEQRETNLKQEIIRTLTLKEIEFTEIKELGSTTFNFGLDYKIKIINSNNIYFKVRENFHRQFTFDKDLQKYKYIHREDSKEELKEYSNISEIIDDLYKSNQE